MPPTDPFHEGQPPLQGLQLGANCPHDTSPRPNPLCDATKTCPGTKPRADVGDGRRSPSSPAAPISGCGRAALSKLCRSLRDCRWRCLRLLHFALEQAGRLRSSRRGFAPLGGRPPERIAWPYRSGAASRQRPAPWHRRERLRRARQCICRPRRNSSLLNREEYLMAGAPLEKTEDSGIFRRGPKYVVDARVNGKQQRETVHTLDDARRLKRSRETDRDQGGSERTGGLRSASTPRNGLTVTRATEARIQARTRERLRRHLELMPIPISTEAGRTVATIRPRDIPGGLLGYVTPSSRAGVCR